MVRGDLFYDVIDTDHKTLKYNKGHRFHGLIRIVLDPDQSVNLWPKFDLRFLALRWRSGLFFLLFLPLLVRNTQFGGALQSGFIVFLVLSFLLRLTIHLR